MLIVVVSSKTKIIHDTKIMYVKDDDIKLLSLLIYTFHLPAPFEISAPCSKRALMFVNISTPESSESA